MQPAFSNTPLLVHVADHGRVCGSVLPVAAPRQRLAPYHAGHGDGRDAREEQQDPRALLWLRCAAGGGLGRGAADTLRGRL